MMAALPRRKVMRWRVKKINANKLNDCNVYITTKRILFLYEVEASVRDEGLIYTLDFKKYCTRNEIEIIKGLTSNLVTLL